MSAEAQPSLTQQVVTGAAWMLGARMAMRLSGLINVMILARMLTPDDFGVFGLTVAFIAAFEAMSDFSLTAALVRHKGPERKHYDTIFSLSLLRGAGLAAICVLGADWVAAFYGDDRIVIVAYALAAHLLVTGMWNPGIADLQRNLDFRRDFVFLTVRKLGSLVACVTCAFTIYPDYRALIAGLLVGSSCSLIASYLLSPYRPRLSLAAFSELFGFSKWMALTNLLRFVQLRADTFILGKTVGLSALGVYAMALELANLVATEFAMPLRRAFMPGFAKLQDDPQELRAAFTRAFGAAMLIATPIALGVALVAGPLIALAFGPNWAAAAAPMQVLAIYGLCRAATTFCWPLIVAVGAPRAMVMPTVVSLIIGLPAIYWGSLEGGLVGAGLAITLMAAINTALMLRAASRLTALSAADTLRWVPRVALASAAMAGSVLWFQSILPSDNWANAIALFGSAAIGAVSYATTLLVAWVVAGRPDGAEAMIVTLMPARLRNIIN